MKYLLILLLPFFGNSEIRYKQLTWEDFKGKPPAGTTAHACTCSNIVIGMDTAYAIFVPERSWTRTKDSALLRHEQGHFGITNKIAKKISALVKYYNDVAANERPAIGDMLSVWRSVQQQYDDETDHGQNATTQKQWEEKIKL